MGRESKTEWNRDVRDRRPSGEDGRLPLVNRTRVEDVMARSFVSLPAWFPAAKAAQVLRQTGKSFVLIGGPGGAQQMATLRELMTAPAEKSIAWCGSALGPDIAVDAGVDEALALMDRRGVDRVAVMLGKLLVGSSRGVTPPLERSSDAPGTGSGRLAA